MLKRENDKEGATGIGHCSKIAPHSTGYKFSIALGLISRMVKELMTFISYYATVIVFQRKPMLGLVKTCHTNLKTCLLFTGHALSN